MKGRLTKRALFQMKCIFYISIYPQMPFIYCTVVNCSSSVDPFNAVVED
jgi:hypothetical protein